MDDYIERYKRAKQRRARVRQMVAAGTAIAAIARDLGVSRQRVYQIIERSKREAKT